MRTPEEQKQTELNCKNYVDERADFYIGKAGWYYDARCGSAPTSKTNKAHHMEPWRCSLGVSGVTMEHAKRPGWMFMDEYSDFGYWMGSLLYSPLCNRDSRGQDRFKCHIEIAPADMPKCKHCLRILKTK